MQIPPGFRGLFRTDEAARALYSEGAGIYRILPSAVALPSDTKDLVALLEWAADSGHPLVPRGAGSGMPGGNVGPGIVVDLVHCCAGAPVVDAARRRVAAGASATCREIEIAASSHGLFLPIDPSSSAFCTIGGMVATNAAGSRSLKYGATRAWVHALEFVTADGESGRLERGAAGPRTATAAERRFRAEALPFLDEHRDELASAVPATRKNSSGYFLSGRPEDGILDLLIGSEGTLAVITAVELRLARTPAARATLLVTLASLDHVAQAVSALASVEPASIELLDRTWLDFVRSAAHDTAPEGTEAVLLVEVEGGGDVARAAANAVAPLATRTTVAQDPGSVARLWAIRHLASPTLAAMPDRVRSLQVVEDGCVPRERLGDYISGLRRLAGERGFEIVIFGHAGDGHVHANVLANVAEPEFVARLGALLEDVSGLQLSLSGTLAGEHGDGRLRAPFLEDAFGPLYMEACRRIKAAFDPRGILNPGVKLPAPRAGRTPGEGELKVGPSAPPVPGDVAAALRRIEREAAWGTQPTALLEFEPASRSAD